MSHSIKLSDDVIDILKQIVVDLKKENSIEPDFIIRSGIFGILENKCTVLYYPLPDEKNRGFHIKRLVNDSIEDFVYINTDKTVEQQVFTAAHELGHIYNVYSKVCKEASLRGILLDGNDKDYEEKITDRFAAEFIMPEQVFIKNSKKYFDELNISDLAEPIKLLIIMAKLMADYLAPFDAVRKRLNEVGLIGESANKYFSLNKIELEKIINVLKKDDNSMTNSKTNIKTISGLRNFIHKAVNSPDTDKALINRIKNDFGLEDIEQIALNDDRFLLDDMIKIND